MPASALILLPPALRLPQAVPASVMAKATGMAGARNASAPPGAAAG